jgi:polysaccharide biosynthesis/export protein
MPQENPTYHIRRRCCFALVILGIAYLPLCAQNGKGLDGMTTSKSEVWDYSLGPGDILSITIIDSPELTGKYRVTQDGYIVLPGVSDPVRANGVSARELSEEIAIALKAAQLLQEPTVNVFLEEYHSKTVTVLGAVNKPSVYPLPRPTTVLEVLSLAGGLTPTAGATLTIIHKGSSATNDLAQTDREPSKSDSSISIDLGRLMQGKDPSLNVEVHPGETVSASTAPIVYVIGAVTKPGGYVLQDPGSGVTILQALALAAGLKSIAAGGRSLVIRRSEGGLNRQEIPVDVQKLLAGKTEDQFLQANDILFVPESGMKRNLERIGRVAEESISGITIYGVGYRAAGLTH